MTRSSLLIAAAALLAPVPALAQAYQCTLPGRIEPQRAPVPDAAPRRTAIARYTLAVSWSPEYCRGARVADRANRIQCSGANGRFGYVLHGLWPEARSGPPPQWCAITPRPSPELLRRNLCMTPAPGLLEHEWGKHGSCMAGSPEGYFRVASILWHSLRFPQMDRLSRDKALTAGDLRRAFVAANPGWRPEAVGLLTSRSGWLRELKLCYSRKFLPEPCPRFNFGPPDRAPLKIWRGA